MSEESVHRAMTGQDEPLVEVDLPRLDDDEVLIEIAGRGACCSDLERYRDEVRTNCALPTMHGQEIGGHVVDTGAHALWWIDRAVIVPAVIPCGTCTACRRGREAICPNRRMPSHDLQGGIATHIVAPARALCPVDESRLSAAGIALADLATIAGVVTTSYRAVVQAGVENGDLVVVNGAGGVGSYVTQIANALGAAVVAIDIDCDKLAAIEGQGVALSLNARMLSLPELRAAIRAFGKVRGLRPNEWIIFECSGTRAGQESAFGLLNHGATLCVVGFSMDKAEVRLSNLMALYARAFGVSGCPPELYPEALEFVLSGQVKPTSFVAQHPLSRIDHAFGAVCAGRFKRRAVLVPTL